MIPRVLDRMGNAVLVEVVRIIQEGTGVYRPDVGAACVLCQRPRAKVLRTEGTVRFHRCGHCSLRFRSIEADTLSETVEPEKVFSLPEEPEKPQPRPKPKNKKR